MARYINKTVAPIHVAGVMLVPGIPAEVPADAVKLKGFQRLLDNREVEETSEKAPSGTDAQHEVAKTSGGSQPSQPAQPKPADNKKD